MTTYYVAKTGLDTNTGADPAHAKLTITAALPLMTAGGATLEIAAGIYTEHFYCGVDAVNIRPGDSWAAPITLKRYQNDAVTIQRTSGNAVFNFAHDGLILAIDQQYIILDGLIIDANGGFWGVQMESTSNHIRIKNCEIKNATAQGVNCDADFCEMFGSQLHNHGTTFQHHGIYVSGSDNVVHDNEFYNISGYGIHNYNGHTSPPETADRNTFYGNTVHDTGTSLDSTTGGILIGSGTGNMAYNNICYNNYTGIKAGYGINGVSEASKIYNNTVYNNSLYGIHIQTESTHCVVRNNISYLHGTQAIKDDGTSSVISNNLTTSDPLFFNPAGHDFHLKPGSPAIDAGMDLSSSFNTDKDGRPRG